MATTAALLIVFFLATRSVSGTFPRAQNVTWKSTNFKTILTWEPKPSADYSYTVEYSTIGGDSQRNRHCIRSSMTSCDLSSSLTDLNACYRAEVQSEPPRGATSELVEFPFTTSPNFCPYKDTDIGKPEFKLEVSEDQKKTTLYVTDPLTALFKDGRQLNIRDIFKDQLMYRVTYRRSGSTGKKTLDSKTNTIELATLDRGENYCFYVQAFIPSRSTDKKLGEVSETKCTENNKSFFDEYSVGVIAAAIFLILILIGIIIAVTVVCCKRKNKAEKESHPLRNLDP